MVVEMALVQVAVTPVIVRIYFYKCREMLKGG